MTRRRLPIGIQTFRTLHSQTGQRVAVFIDEYDK